MKAEFARREKKYGMQVTRAIHRLVLRRGIDGSKAPVLGEHEPNQPTDRPSDRPLHPRQAGGGVVLEKENRVYRPLTSFIPTKLRHVYAASPSAMVLVVVDAVP
ncbi:unnamed protein product [Lasius platythorax]|uniref:Uncharacterized protein n=1 Tax=Lasius platythorax TaxID=488582 RepID=A0AAV2P362_9HYME